MSGSGRGNDFGYKVGSAVNAVPVNFSAFADHHDIREKAVFFRQVDRRTAGVNPAGLAAQKVVEQGINVSGSGGMGFGTGRYSGKISGETFHKPGFAVKNGIFRGFIRGGQCHKTTIFLSACGIRAEGFVMRIDRIFCIPAELLQR